MKGNPRNLIRDGCHEIRGSRRRMICIYARFSRRNNEKPSINYLGFKLCNLQPNVMGWIDMVSPHEARAVMQ